MFHSNGHSQYVTVHQNSANAMVVNKIKPGTYSYSVIIWVAEGSLGSHTFLQRPLQVTT